MVIAFLGGTAQIPYATGYGDISLLAKEGSMYYSGG